MNQSEASAAQEKKAQEEPAIPALLKGLNLSEISSPSNSEGVVIRTAKVAPPTPSEIKKAINVLNRALEEQGGFRDELGKDDIGITYTLSVHTAEGQIRKISSSQIIPGLLEQSQLPTALGTLKTTLALIIQPVESSVLDQINQRVDRYH